MFILFTPFIVRIELLIVNTFSLIFVRKFLNLSDPIFSINMPNHLFSIISSNTQLGSSSPFLPVTHHSKSVQPTGVPLTVHPICVHSGPSHSVLASFAFPTYCGNRSILYFSRVNYREISCPWPSLWATTRLLPLLGPPYCIPTTRKLFLALM